MRTIQISYKALLLATFIATPALAQENSLWPKTFVGQPDFEFARQDVIDEFTRKKGVDASKYIATLTDLFTSQNIDPYTPKPLTSDIGRSKYSKDVFEQRFGLKKKNKKFRSVYPDIAIGSGLEVHLGDGTVAQAELLSNTQAKILSDGRKINIEVDEEGYVLESHRERSISESFENLLGGNQYLQSSDLDKKDEKMPEISGLPEYHITTSTLPDLDKVTIEQKEGLEAFASFLENIITQATKARDADIKDIDFNAEFSKFSIQSIVTSPYPYAIINNHRFSIGDRIPVQISLATKDTSEMEALIDSYMPNEKAISAESFKQYSMLKSEALRQFKERTGQDGKKITGETHKISATIKAIESRKVIINLFDIEYALEIKLAL
ncbi:MAG: hypothetical protein ACI8QY_000892 [bacterium]|jgi:hypothetical protein